MLYGKCSSVSEFAATSVIECTIFSFLPGLCSWAYAFSYKKLGFDTSSRLDIK